jgi:UrcA family protein
MSQVFSKPFLAAALLAGVAIAATAPVRAQDYSNAAYDEPESVIVEVPRLHTAPDGTVKMTRDVDIRDIDLRTRDGARALRSRIRETAEDMCEELWSRTTAPGERVEGSDLRRCAHDAYRKAMSQVHEAIYEARNEE